MNVAVTAAPGAGLAANTAAGNTTPGSRAVPFAIQNSLWGMIGTIAGVGVTPGIASTSFTIPTYGKRDEIT